MTRGWAGVRATAVGESAPAAYTTVPMDSFVPPDRREPLLFAALPGIARPLPWTPPAPGPTAVEPCTAIADYLGRDDVWMKRDDLISPLYGGNKVRRYEFVLADALARGARAIVTTGGLASTQ